MSWPRGSQRSASPMRAWRSSERRAWRASACTRSAWVKIRAALHVQQGKVRTVIRCLPAALVAALLVCPPLWAATPIPAPPAVKARAYILVDHFSGRGLAQEQAGARAQARAGARAEPASLTKLMTAYVVFSALKEGRLKLTDMVTISEHAWHAEGSRTFVQVGTQIPVDILIKGMIVQSGNDATVALAERVGGSEP